MLPTLVRLRWLSVVKLDDNRCRSELPQTADVREALVGEGTRPVPDFGDLVREPWRSLHQREGRKAVRRDRRFATTSRATPNGISASDEDCSYPSDSDPRCPSRSLIVQSRDSQ